MAQPRVEKEMESQRALMTVGFKIILSESSSLPKRNRLQASFQSTSSTGKSHSEPTASHMRKRLSNSRRYVCTLAAKTSASHSLPGFLINFGLQ